MTKKEFKNGFDIFDLSEFKAELEIEEGIWENQIKKWKNYYNAIISDDGLPFKKWVKSGDDEDDEIEDNNEDNENDEKDEEVDDGYLPDFLEKKEKLFGHARGGGSMESSMIYYNTGNIDGKKNKYYDAYSEDSDSENTHYFASREVVERDYNDHIKPLLKKIVGAKTLTELYEVEANKEYDRFSGKQLLRKISILISCDDDTDTEIKNAFLWIFDEGKIRQIAKLLGVTYDENQLFLYNNNNVYKKALEFAEINKEPSKLDLIKLNYYLVFLIGETRIQKEISIMFDNGIKQVIFTAAPGTGKTYSAKQIASNDEKAVAIKKDGDIEIKYEFVQFHPSYDYTDFVEGLRPIKLEGNDNPTFVRMDGIFKDFCRKAAFSYNNHLNLGKDEADAPRFYIIIDEINRADLSKVFGELMYCLEYRGPEGKVRTQYSNLETYIITKNGPKTFDEISKNETEYKEIIDSYGKEDLFKDGFYIPENVYIIGTMNDIDRSVESFDFALRRRFKWYEIKAKDAMKEVLFKVIADSKAYTLVKNRISNLNNFISKPDENEMGLTDAYCIGPAYFKNFKKMDGSNKVKIENIYKFEIEPTLKEYVRGRNQTDVEIFLSKCKERFGISKDYKLKIKESI